MRIVLEGCDCTGKTVFARKLEEKIKDLYGVKEVMHEHEGLPPDVSNLFEYYAIKALTYDFCIHDRLHLGERTYGLVYRNNDRLGAVGQHIIDHIIASEGFGVICTHPFEEVEKRWHRRLSREYVKDSDSLRRIHAAYNDYSSGHWMVIDPFIENEKSIVFARLRDLHKNNKLIPFVWGIGPSTAETLIVGETSNHPIYDLPFFSTTGSSAYLITTLMRLGIGHNYYLTNAFRKDGSPRIMKPIINELKKLKRVIALGHAATKLLSQQGVPAVNIAHPQFYHRFKHHEAMEYLKLFKISMEVNNAAELRLL